MLVRLTQAYAVPPPAEGLLILLRTCRDPFAFTKTFPRLFVFAQVVGVCLANESYTKVPQLTVLTICARFASIFWVNSQTCVITFLKELAINVGLAMLVSQASADIL